MVLTWHDVLGNTGLKTGFGLEEFAAAYLVFRDAGVQLTLASARGGNHPSVRRAIYQQVRRLPSRNVIARMGRALKFTLSTVVISDWTRRQMKLQHWSWALSALRASWFATRLPR
jgi:hypothetical protein